MATIRFQHFTRPEILRSIEPARLVRFLTPYREELAERGLILPASNRQQSIDYWALIKILLAPDPKLPPRLIESLYYIDDMATPEGMDALLVAVEARGARLDIDNDPTPADVAVEVWLNCREILEQKHGERHLKRRRSFEYYQCERRRKGEWKEPPPSRLAEFEESLDNWFAQKRQGRGTRILRYYSDGIQWFMVRHGEPLKREESLKSGQPDAVLYRPIRYDIIGYHPELNELRVNARRPGERDLYRKQFGLHIFGDIHYFPGEAKYSLEPLRDQGELSLVCSDIDGLDWIKLIEVELDYGGHLKSRKSHFATDLFEQLAIDGERLPEEPRLTAATFTVKFTGMRDTRAVTIRPSNVALYLRDSDAILIELWLERRGFIYNRGSGYGATHDVLEIA